MAGTGGWGQFQQLQDRFSGLIQAKWASGGSNNKTRNVTDSKRDLLFVWNPKECNILVANVALVANAPDGGKTHQVLELTSIPDFTVDRLLVNDTCTYLALVGTRMVFIVSLPGRWGSSGLFNAGHDNVLCKSHAVDSSFFIRSQSLEIRDFHWCPAPLPDQLFIILASNNTLRLYRATSPDSVLQKWKVGRTPMNPQSSSHLPLLTCLGETAVSFDFLPQMPVSALDSGVTSPETERTLLFSSTPIPPNSPPDGNNEQSSEVLVWPIAVLFGNGDVFIVVPPNFNADTSSGLNAKLFGPLRMHPSTPDNYGTESCSLLCLPCQPPVLVIASSSGGVIYHSVLLQKHPEAAEVSDDQTSFFEPGGEDLGISECQKALYVVEKVALELGLLTTEQEEEEAEDSPFHCRIHLYKDPNSTSRYFCCHEAGVNIISVPLVSEIQKIAARKTSLDSVLDFLPTDGLASVEQYLLCTQASNQSSCQRVQGLTVLSTQSMALCILPSGRCALLPLPLALMQPDSPIKELDEDDAKIQKSSASNAFVDQVKRTLSHSSSQPLVMLPPGSSPSDKELLEILKRSTQTLRTEYLAKHVIVREEFKRKVTILKNTVDVRKRQIGQTDAQINELAASMEKTKANLEGRMNAMNRFLKRLQYVQTQLSLAEPETSVAEQKLKEFVEESSAKVLDYQTTIKSLNSRVESIQKLEDAKKKERKESIYLTEEQGKTIKAALAENSKELTRMKMRLEGILKAVGNMSLNSSAVY